MTAATRKAFLPFLALALLLPARLSSGTAEEDEAARIQIGGNASANLETLALSGSGELAVSSWHGCVAEAREENGLKLLRFEAPAGAKPWAGFRASLPKGGRQMEIPDAAAFASAKLEFKLKAPSGSGPGSLQVCVSGFDASGKSAQSSWLPLRNQKPDASGWVEVSIPLKELDGSASLKSLSGAGFQYLGAPPEGIFRVESLRLARTLSKAAGLSFEIEDPDLSSLALTGEKFPASASNIRISGGNFTRDGKPVFLTGVEDDAINFPWLYKLMGFDIVQLQDFAPANQLRWSVSQGKARVSWTPLDPWIDTKVRWLLSNGFALHVNYWDNVPEAPAFKEAFGGALAETSHFYCLRLDDPLGRELKEKYFKASFKTLGKYPVAFYELYNEIYYGDASPAAIEAFQRLLKAKYGDIALANKALGCSFASFENVQPPRKKARWMVTKNELAPKDLSPEFYAEWQKFLEAWLGKQFRLLTANVKKELKSPSSYVIYQATMGLPQDFSGFTGTDPYELFSAEDALCHEGGMVFVPQERGSEKSQEIAKMGRSLFIWDLLKNISPEKPVYLSECGVGSYAASFDKGGVRLDLAGPWRFADDSDGQGLAQGFQKRDFDDSSWKNVNVPGVWGSQGFPKCQAGWYRRSFDAPASPSGRLFITGKELADTAQIYLNGALVFETFSWNEAFSVDATSHLKPEGNVLAIRIANNYEVAGQIQGGVRDFIALTDKQFFVAPKLTAGQMRSWFWSMAVHDVSGVVMSYFYTPATNKDVSSIYSPVTRSYEAIRAIPEVKNEISSVAETLLPRPRVKSSVAVVYPFESGRARIPDNAKDMFTGRISVSATEYYLAALFSQLDAGATSCKALVDGSAGDLKAVVLASSPRVPSGLPEKLEAFVANGGALLLDYGSMSFDDDSHKPLPAPSWLGVRPGAPLTAAGKTSSALFGFKDIECEKRFSDGSFGVALESSGAETLASFEDGSPAISAFKHGKGAVYYFACKLPFPELKKALSSILARHGVLPQTKLEALDGGPADYVESHVIGSPDSSVWYLNNFGGGTLKLKAAWPGAASGSYKVTDLRTAKTLYAALKAEDLRKGVALEAPSQDPVALLLERAGSGKKETEVAPLSKESRRFLEMWRQSPPGELKVLFNSCSRDEIDPFRMLTGKKLLEDSGFEIHYAVDTPKNGLVKSYFSSQEAKSLSDFAIYVLPGSRIRDEAAAKEIASYVKNGGSILLSGTANFGYFGWMSNVYQRKKLFDIFDLRCSDVNFTDAERNFFSPLFCEFSEIASGHPVTNGVASVQLAGASVIKPGAEGQEVLIRSNGSSSPQKAPFLIAMEFGKGRVIAMGDAQWMEPEWLCKAGNAQLMLNIFNWLARRDCQPLPKDKLAAAVNCSFGD